MSVYLDNSATTAVLPEVAQTVLRCMTDDYGNPSSLHGMGVDASLILRQARTDIAKKLGVSDDEIFFTSGGTESNNIAMFGVAEKNKSRKGRVIVSAIEHDCVINPAEQLAQNGFDVIFIKPDEKGKISPAAVENALTDDTVLVSVMLVNNETGAIQDVAAISSAIKRRGCKAVFHCDAVQAFGKMPVFPRKLGCDTMTVSAHKLHGPKGVGALYIRKGLNIPARNLGGGQERNMRSGTEAVELISGFAEAVRLIPDTEKTLEKVAGLHDRLANGLAKISDVSINSPDDALPYLLNFSYCGIRSEVLLRFLSAEGIYVSAGSACAKGGRSHVLTAQGLSAERIDSAVRVSFSRFSTESDVDALLEALNKASSLKRGRK